LTKKVLVPGAGHWIQQERPTEVNDLVIQFLNVCSDRARAGHRTNSRTIFWPKPLKSFVANRSDALEGFLGAIYYPDRESTQRALDRVTQMTRASFGGRLPDSFRGKIFEYPDGKFDFRAEYTDGMASCNGFAERTDSDFIDSGSLCHGSNPCEVANYNFNYMSNLRSNTSSLKQWKEVLGQN
jgi:hypothetical protein